MQRNEVIDLRNYRGNEDDAAGIEDPATGDELPAGTTILHGQYKITGFLNSGGFGITYRAHDSLGREVVIKECFPGVMCFRAGLEVRVRSRSHEEEFSNMVKNFVKEAHALAAMDHKNIVKVHQVFEENETAYMAIDYIDGIDLLDLIEQDPDRLGPREIERLTKKSLRAIQYIHDRGMLHRDISPDNILLDADDEPILIDFGAAREKAKKSGRIMSRLKFVKDGYSPQEFYVEGSDQGPWSDLYSLAASLYHLIDGAPPLDGQQRMSALAQKQPDPYEPLHGRIKGYSRGFLKAIDKSLEVVPVERFQSANDWLEAIRSTQERRISRPRSRDRAPALAKRDAPVTTVPSPAPSSTQAPAPVRSSAIESKPTSQQSAPPQVATQRTPSLSQRASELTPEEQLVRDTMKGELRPQSSSKAGLMLGGAAVAIISVIGTVGLFVLGGGSETDVTTSTEVTSAPVTVTEPVVAQPEPNATPLPTEEGSQIASAPVAPSLPTAPDTTEIGISDSIAAPEQNTVPVDPAESVEIAAAPAPADTRPDPAIDALDPRSDTVVPTTRAQEPNRLAQAKPAARPSNLVPAPDNDTQFANLALALNEPTEVTGIPPVDPARLLPNIAPSVFLLSDTTKLAPAPLKDGGAAFDVSKATDTLKPQIAAALPSIAPAQTPIIRTAAPAPLPETVADGPLVAAQVQYSHWDVDMPFESELVKVRNADTIKITAVSPSADLSLSGEWIAEGVTIYTFNGEKLLPDTPMSVHVLTSMSIDPDGYARASVRYQPAGGTIDRGLLAVPIVREIGLADGTVLTVRNVERTWTVTVTAFGDGTEGTLRLGDQMVQETTTGIDIVGHESVQKALDALVLRDIETAEFNVIRGGTLTKASLALARETGGGG